MKSESDTLWLKDTSFHCHILLVNPNKDDVVSLICKCELDKDNAWLVNKLANEVYCSN